MRSSLLQARLARGEAKTIIGEINQLIASKGEEWSEAFRAQVNTLRKVIAGNMNAEELYSLEQSLRSEGETPNFRLQYLLLGKLDHYFDTWETAIDDGRIELFAFRYIYIPGGRIIVEHPRFLLVAERFGLIPFWEKHGYPMGCERVDDESGARLVCADWPE